MEMLEHAQNFVTRDLKSQRGAPFLFHYSFDVIIYFHVKTLKQEVESRSTRKLETTTAQASRANSELLDSAGIQFTSLHSQ